MFPLATPSRALPSATPMASLRHLPLNHHRPSFHSPSLSSSFSSPSSLSFRPQFHSSKSSSSSSIRASISQPSQNDPPKDTFLSRILHSLNPLVSPAVETTCIVIASTVFFFMRFHHTPVIAAPLSPPSSTVEYSLATEEAPNEDKEREIEGRLTANPNDIEAIRTLMELKIKACKIDKAIAILDRLIDHEPDEFEWPLLKAHMHVYNDQGNLARNVFEEILKKDPLKVEAYHGLAMATSDSKEPLKGLLKRVEDAAEQCKKQKKDSEVRDFRLLIAQIKVMDGELNEALKAYQELVKEERTKRDEAEKQFDKFRRLVPKNHPYKEYFEENMFATKFFSQKLEREGAGARS